MRRTGPRAEFFRFLSSPEVQVFWHKETGYVPITTRRLRFAKAEGYYEGSAPGRSRQSSSFRCRAAITPMATGWASTSRSAT